MSVTKELFFVRGVSYGEIKTIENIGWQYQKLPHLLLHAFTPLLIEKRVIMDDAWSGQRNNLHCRVRMTFEMKCIEG